MTHKEQGDHHPGRAERRDCSVRIIRNEGVGRDCFLMIVHCPEIARISIPGQFLMVRIACDVTDPLLRRPISIMEITPDGDIALMYKVVGRGTRILADKSPGDSVCIFGPLGNGFTPPPQPHSALLVGGGIGIPPLFFLASDLAAGDNCLSITACLGGRSVGDVLLESRFVDLGVKVYKTTEDGSSGETGRVTGPLKRLLSEIPSPVVIYACGPEPMLRAIDGICAVFNVPGQLAFEEHMGCGVGACLGCIIETTQGILRVCSDGPVFPAGIVSRWRSAS